MEWCPSTTRQSAFELANSEKSHCFCSSPPTLTKRRYTSFRPPMNKNSHSTFDNQKGTKSIQSKKKKKTKKTKGKNRKVSETVATALRAWPAWDPRCFSVRVPPFQTFKRCVSSTPWIVVDLTNDSTKYQTAKNRTIYWYLHIYLLYTSSTNNFR